MREKYRSNGKCNKNLSVSLSFDIPPGSPRTVFLSYAAPCGGVFSGTQGEMMSPNWPTGNYPALSVCTWRISVPSNTSIHVGFSHFELQAKNLLGACGDYVDVVNGENMETLGRLGRHLRSRVSTHCCGLMLLLLLLAVVVLAYNGVKCCCFFFHVQVGSAVPPLLPTSPFLATQLSSASSATQPIRKRVSVVTGRQMPVLFQLCLLQPLSHKTTATGTGGCLLCQHNMPPLTASGSHLDSSFVI